MKTMPEKQKLAIYQAKDGSLELRKDAYRETIWANLDQIASLFGRDKSVISRHIKNIFKDEELEKNSTVAFFATVQKEGNRKVKRDIEFFNLDLILSVGYRVNSKIATQFRQWATKTLKEHITNGFTINPKRIEKNHQAFLKAVEDIKLLTKDNDRLLPKDVLELIKGFSYTWFSLDSYDKKKFPRKGSVAEITLTAKEFLKDLAKLKKELMQKREATEIFTKSKIWFFKQNSPRDTCNINNSYCSVKSKGKR